MVTTGSEEFLYETEPTKKPTGATYCGRCEDTVLLPLRQNYTDTFNAAKAVSVVPKNYRGRVTVIRKANVTLHTGPWADKSQAELALAFGAAKKGFNAILQADFFGKKVRNHGYQHTEWTGSAVPADIQERQEDLY
jgi:hypothetical protein